MKRHLSVAFPLVREKQNAKRVEHQGVLFDLYSLGMGTNRDEIMYNFNRVQLGIRITEFITHYNAEVERYRKAGRPKDIDNFVDYSHIKWSSALKRQLTAQKQAIRFSEQSIRVSLYRPFSKQNLYLDKTFIHTPGLFPRIFPTLESERENRAIITAGIGNRKAFGAFITQHIPSLDFAFEKVQYFPFYVYDPDGSNRRKNITDWALQEFQAQHGASVTKWDIFYYVYGVLHDPTYRTRFADNLKKDLPRIPILANFTAYRDAGKRLATLHLDYEKQPRFRDLQWEHAKDADGKPVPVTLPRAEDEGDQHREAPRRLRDHQCDTGQPHTDDHQHSARSVSVSVGQSERVGVDHRPVSGQDRQAQWDHERPEHLQRQRTLHHRASRARR
ncbi:MAG UNVERIFIED_CONTAM: hypothetical protein LVT10_25590 [Anaerolineae bacterium]|jgi:predicted helicase